MCMHMYNCVYTCLSVCVFVCVCVGVRVCLCECVSMFVSGYRLGMCSRVMWSLDRVKTCVMLSGDDFSSLHARDHHV